MQTRRSWYHPFSKRNCDVVSFHVFISKLSATSPDQHLWTSLPVILRLVYALYINRRCVRRMPGWKAPVSSNRHISYHSFPVISHALPCYKSDTRCVEILISSPLSWASFEGSMLPLYIEKAILEGCPTARSRYQVRKGC